MTREIVKVICELGSPERASAAARFFKTGIGEYGEGDVFLGVSVPKVRGVVREYRDRVSMEDMRELLASPYHEVRLCALLLMVARFERGNAAVREEVYGQYIVGMERVNNWDLVDTSAYKIAGAHLLARGDMADQLLRFAESTHMWTRRMAMVATFAGIRVGETSSAVRVATRLRGERHDLMQKAVGWMLREVGKRDGGALRDFLERYAGELPRTCLRYAVERMEVGERGRYMGMGKK